MNSQTKTKKMLHSNFKDKRKEWFKAANTCLGKFAKCSLSHLKIIILKMWQELWRSFPGDEESRRRKIVPWIELQSKPNSTKHPRNFAFFSSQTKHAESAKKQVEGLTLYKKSQEKMMPQLENWQLATSYTKLDSQSKTDLFHLDQCFLG